MPAYGTIDSNEENYKTKQYLHRKGGGQNKGDKEAVNQDEHTYTKKKQVNHQ